jgi:hypothetical protein
MMSDTLKISFADLAVVRQNQRLPLDQLTLDDHVHGELRIEVAGRCLPHLGYFGGNDVCMADWLAELAGVRDAFTSSESGRYVFDEGEQGQPAFVFERIGDQAYVTIADAEYSGGVADPAWQHVEFSAAALISEEARFRQTFAAHLTAAVPAVGSQWLAAHVRGSAGPSTESSIESLVRALESAEAQIRERAADEITDVHRGMAPEQVRQLALALVAAAVNEPAHAAQEAQLNALVELRAAHGLEEAYFRPLKALRGRLPSGYADYLDDLLTGDST